MQFSGKRAIVLGFGVEGAAAADHVLALGGTVEMRDVKEEKEFSSELLEEYRKRGVSFRFGPGGTLDGADIIIRSPGVPPGIPPLAAARAKGVPITSGTELFFEACPAPIVGVTGTKGKGTTSSLLHAMLLAAGRDSHLVGNIGTPALRELASLGPRSIVVYELSSFQLMDVAQSPRIAVVLMVTRDHLDFHINEEEYVLAKAGIARFQTADDIVIANGDYERSRRIAAMSPGKKFWISRHGEVAEGCFVKDGAMYIRKAGGERRIAAAGDMALYGSHNLENACAAIMAADSLGVPDEAMRKALRSFTGLPHRLQLVGQKNGTRYFDDSISTTPESAVAAIQAFGEPKIIVLGGHRKGTDFKELAREIAENRSIKAVIGIGEEWPRIKAELEEGGAKSEGRDLKIVENCQTMDEVVASASRIASPGDIVLLSPGCASFGMFRNYKDRGDQFAKAVGEL